VVAVIPSAPVNRNARDIIRQEILVRDDVTGILSGKRNCFRDGERGDIFRWDKLFQGW